MTRVFNQPSSQPYNYETITDGVLIGATGIRFVNTEAGRVYGGIVFGAAGSTIENQLGGIIGLSRDQATYDTATSIIGSSGADAVVNAGTIKGSVVLGDGADSFIERGETGHVDLGTGNDSYVQDSTGYAIAVEGGDGRDSLTLSRSTNLHGGTYTGFEDLTLVAGTIGIGFSGYASIKFQGAGDFSLYDSSNPTIDVSLSNQALTLGNSSFASITGSGGSESIDLLGDRSHISGDLKLGAGADSVTFADNVGRTSMIDGVIDGGGGRDTLRLSWFYASDHNYDLSRVENVEVLSVNGDRTVEGESDVGISHADGFSYILTNRGTVLTLSASNSPNANADVIGETLILNDDVTLRRIGFSDEFGFEHFVDLMLADDSQSTTVINHGTITSEIRFYTGDDLYDGTTGSVGGIVYGNAGNDTLLGGAGREVMAGGYGADLLEGNGGDDALSGDAGGDVLRGGAGADVLTGGTGNDLFKGTHADLGGDTIADLARGDRIAVSDAALDSFAYSRVGGTLTFAGGASITLGGAPNVRLAIARTDDGVTLTAINRDGHLRDFDGDGHSDILWTTGGGAISSWTVSGNVHGDQLHQNSFFATVDPSWRAVETFDFDGDGRSDILWRNTSGAISVWRADAGGFAQGVYNHGDVGGSWAIAATGDYDGDGKDDILWRDAGGALSIWRATGTGFTENTYFHGAVGSGWKVAGSTDLDGDGRDDIVWRHDDGGVSTWQASGSGFVESVFDQAVPTSWHIAGLGDLNGDGRGDIVWRNDDGAFSVWQSTGSGFRQDIATQSVPTSWHIEQVGDFNDDGRADILWRNDDGRLSSWQSNGDGFDQDVLHSDGPASEWSIQSHGDLLG